MQFPEIRQRSIVNFIKAATVLAAAISIFLFFGDVVREIAGILFGAALIAFLLAPLCKLLEKKLRRPLAVGIAVVSVFLLLVALFAFLVPMIVRQFISLADLLPDALARIGTLIENLSASFQRNFPEIRLPEPDLSSLGGNISDAARGAVSTISSLADGIYRLFLMVVLSCFLLADREDMLLRLELLVPLSWRRLAVRAGNTLMRELRLYLRGQATIALAVGTLAAIAMLLIGLEAAPLLGLIVGIFNVIPYFGPLLGGIPAVITALSLSWQRAAMTVLALFLVQQADGMLISPRVMGNITGFSPAVVLIALFAGAKIGSIGGMLLALPTLMAIRTLYRVFVQRHENN